MGQLVRDVMTPVVTAVLPDASLVEAAQLMRAYDVRDVLVAQDGRLLGMLTDRDIVLRAVADGADPLTVPCHCVCTPRVVSVEADEPVAAAVALLRRNPVRRLPVVRNGAPVGMVSIGDLGQDGGPERVPADAGPAAPGR